MRLSVWVLFLLAAGGAVTSAWAGHVSVGVAVGHGYGHGSYGYYGYGRSGYTPYRAYPVYPAYYASPVVLTPPAPTVYVERTDVVAPARAAPAVADDWYYCRKPQGYYPEIEKCPSGWLRAPREPSDLAPRNP